MNTQYKSKMKNCFQSLFYKYGLNLILFVLLSFTGCSKFVAINPPSSQLASNNVYEDDATAASVLTGIYQKMDRAGGFANGNTSLSVLCGLSADELVNFDENNSLYQDFYINSIVPENTIIESTWNNFYNYIYSANSVIEGLSKSTAISLSTKKQLEGEAMFIRAFCYFYLTNLWNNIPLITTTNYQKNAAAQKTGKDSIYTQVIADLKEAQLLLSDDYRTPTGAITDERVRPNKAAATALLARVYLYKEEWANAETEASIVIDNTATYGITDLQNVFIKNSKEAIWQLQSVVPNYNTLEGYTFILLSGPNSTANPVFLSDFITNAFEPGDKRDSIWIGNYNEYKYPFKYKVSIGSDISEYVMVLRLGEQYLIRAEARAHQNNISGAQDDLNVIRNRAGLLNTTANNTTDLLSAIQQERRVELFTEWGQRWLDLKRTNTADSVMTLVTRQKGGIWQEGAKLYPIPRNELMKNPNLTPQNPGYPN